MTTKPASDFRINARLRTLLAEAPATTTELADRLHDEGLELGRDTRGRLINLLDGCSAFIEVGEDRWASVDALTDGISWTTTVDEDDAADDRLRVDPDLALLAWLMMDEPAALPSGEELYLDIDDDAIVGPPGWLARLGGRTVAVRRDGSTIAVTPLDQPPNASPAMITAVREAFASVAEEDEWRDPFGGDGTEDGDGDDSGVVTITNAGLDDVLWTALLLQGDAFRAAPVPPIDDLLREAGLERDGHRVGVTDTDWGALEALMRQRRLSSLYSLGADQTLALLALVGAEQMIHSGDPDALGVNDDDRARGAMFLIACLHDAKVAAAFWGHHLSEETPPARLVTFADVLLDWAGDIEQITAAPRWLRARALDLDGRAGEAEQELLLAASVADQPFAPVDRALAAFAADRGDARRALTLLQRAGANEDDPLLDEVTPWAMHRPRATAGRNDPCPCGSGKKYKVCHLGKEQHPLLDRAGWLYDKACRFLRDGAYRAVVADLASTMATASRRGGMFLLDLLESELVADVALHEAGLWNEFLAARSALLPDDEALLAASWLLVERSLFEVVHVGADQLRLRDVRRGEEIVVTNTHANTRTRPGTYLVGRPLPVEGTWRAFSGFLPVQALVDEMLEVLDDGDASDVAEILGRCLAPPVMSNTDGEELVFHELVYSVPDQDAARRALAAVLQDNEDGTYAVVRDSRNQKNTVIGTFTLDGDRLTVEVNSDRRAAEMQALVAEVVPDAVLVDHDLRELDEMMRSGSGGAPGSIAGPRPGGAPPAGSAPPEIPAEIMDQIVRQYEEQWLDESIPALRGLTPRQAAADPIGRVELDRLLRQFEGMPGMMNAARLRADLGL